MNAFDVQRPMRAEGILTGAIGIVSIIVLVLAAILWSSERLNRHEVDIVTRVRSARSEVVQLSQAQNDAEGLSARYVSTHARGLLDEFQQAKVETRSHLDALRRIVSDDPEALSAVDRIEALVDQRFEMLDSEVATRRSAVASDHSVYIAFRRETDSLFQLLNSRIDAARAAEDRARVQLDIIAVALAALTLIASALAIIALRREREQWRMAHEATEEARARAAASDLAKSRFLAVASHDMRQPLHALTLYLSALERRVENAEARDIIKKMDRATQSMVGMFSMLLDLARVQAGVITPEFTDVSLQDVIDGLVAENPSGKVDAKSALTVHTDPTLLQRILANLVNNAMKHGGGKAQLTTRAEGGYAFIDVADNGPGIPPEDQERIFEEFVRLEGRGEGLGLGLAIVKRLADLLGIEIALKSAPGQGTRFTLRLPLATSEGPSRQDDSKEGALRGVPVIVMDDEQMAREAMMATLIDFGAEVRACANGEQVFAELDNGFRPRLLLLDLRIDGEWRGIDVARQAVATIEPPPRAIIVTGDTGPEALAALRASGYAWLIKPVDRNDLLTAAAAQLQASET